MVSLPYTCTGALAAADSFMHMGQRFQRHGLSWQLGHVVLLICVVVLTGVGVWMLSRYVQHREGFGYHSPRALFAELCRAHALARSDRRLLARLARARQLPGPANLFVQPNHFHEDQLPGDLRRRRHELQALQDRIFGDNWRADGDQTDDAAQGLTVAD